MMQTKQSWMETVLKKLFANVQGGSFAVTYKSGTTEHFGERDPQFTIGFNEDNILDLCEGDLSMSFGEAYIDGRVDVDGDLAEFISLALRSGLTSVVGAGNGFTGAALRAVSKGLSRKHEKKNIEHHYDLGNDFFHLWLDESLTYSCAYFKNPSDSLERAQKQKIDHSLRKLRLKRDETLLDIGCGWGALVMRAAERYGTATTGITLSREQYALADAAIASRGLQARAAIRLADYRTLAAGKAVR